MRRSNNVQDRRGDGPIMNKMRDLAAWGSDFVTALENATGTAPPPAKDEDSKLADELGAKDIKAMEKAPAEKLAAGETAP
ncbi:hypothetical protein [Bradyrhizobium neotropicale]|uniref:Uncharacterized protein n=1 Tax=Bradyrhizobium neotropicale TaxID=1497615 RepID=A0A176YYI7_9BRAD|nr:hypothetical protein [Bradyrhizobium neotropicale]OAF12820.1 hypothetical protein AXW67_19625 [Bradyrhizobium neotropicale]